MNSLLEEAAFRLWCASQRLPTNDPELRRDFDAMPALPHKRFCDQAAAVLALAAEVARGEMPGHIGGEWENAQRAVCNRIAKKLSGEP